MSKDFKLFDDSIIIGDVHLGRNSNNLLTFNYTERFFREQVLAEAKEMHDNGTEFSVIFVGDIWHSESLISGYIASRFSKFLRDLCKYTSSILVMVGNHDTFTKLDNQENSSNIFISNPNVKIVYNSEVFNVYNTTSKVLVNSYYHDEEEFINVIMNDSSDYCFMHQEIDGFIYKGENSVSKIKKDLFLKYKKTIDGHIHGYQETKHILLTGSIEQCNFGEDKSENRFFVIKFSTGHIEHILNTVSPKHLRIKFDSIRNKKEEELSKMFEQKYVRIYCDNDEDKFICTDKIKNIETALLIKPLKNSDYISYEKTIEEDQEMKSITETVQETAIRLVNEKKNKDFKGFKVTEKIVKNTLVRINSYHEKIA